MSDEREYEPADGEYLTARLSEDFEEAVERYRTDPIVYTLIEKYADLHDISVEEAIRGGTVTVEARHVGCVWATEAEKMQEMLNQKKQFDRLRAVNSVCFVCGHDYDDEEHLEKCANSPRNHD